MHSYWDDFFTLKGLKDAASIAAILGETELAAEYAALRDDSRASLYESIRLARANKHIAYIPGCAELGDFDATSTAISLYPAGKLAYLPGPAGWNHWAEVVYCDSTLARFIGDMPHTWVGSEYLNAVRGMFASEEDDSVLFACAGLRESWLRSEQGITVKNLPTYYGLLSYSTRREKNSLRLKIALKGAVPAGGVRVPPLLSDPIRSVSVNGAEIPVPADGILTITRLPAEIVFRY